MRLALAAVVLVVAAGPAGATAETFHPMTACSGWMSFEGYFKSRKAYLEHEFEIIHKMTPEERTIERGRICGAVNATKILAESMYEQARICRDKGILGMDEAAASLAKGVLQARKQVTDTGC